MSSAAITDWCPVVLLVEDDTDHARIIERTVRTAGFAVRRTATCEEAIDFLESDFCDLVLLDLGLPDGSGLAVQEWLAGRAQSPPVVVVTADDQAEHAAEAISAGATRYVVKRPHYASRLAATISELLAPVLKPRAAPSRLPADPAAALLGSSPGIVEARRLLSEFSRLDSPVLISGELGTGKKLAARIVHRSSGKKGKLVSIDCRELAGAPRANGSEGSTGSLEPFGVAARAGTLILEEACHASLAAQRQLLSVLDQTEHGGFGSPARLIITSTYEPPISTWKEPMLPRFVALLSGLHISLAPLRKRREDLYEIVSAELESSASSRRRPAQQFDVGAWNRLQSHDWPGNVHELLRVVARTVANAGRKRVIDRFDIGAAIDSESRAYGLRAEFDDRERARLRAALDQHEWNVSATARDLGVSRGWLRRRIKTLALD